MIALISEGFDALSAVDPSAIVVGVAGGICVRWWLSRPRVPDCTPGNCYCAETCAYFYVDETA